jgi:hypothetical protein
MNEIDLLISRIVDRRDTPEDWLRLDARAFADGDLSPILVEALRSDALLRRVVDRATTPAERVEVHPGWSRAAGRRRQWSRGLSLGGWMAAAVLTLLWLATAPGGGESPSNPEPLAVVRTAGSEVIQNLPNLMVETRPIPGTEETELIFIRRTLERRQVSGAYTLALNEMGQPVQSAVDLTRYAPRRRY